MKKKDIVHPKLYFKYDGINNMTISNQFNSQISNYNRDAVLNNVDLNYDINTIWNDFSLDYMINDSFGIHLSNNYKTNIFDIYSNIISDIPSV